MTSGHGGCHPVGLALAATTRGLRRGLGQQRKGPCSWMACGIPTSAWWPVQVVAWAQAGKRNCPSGYKVDRPAKLAACYARGQRPYPDLDLPARQPEGAPHCGVHGYDDKCLYFHDRTWKLVPPDNCRDGDSIERQHAPIARPILPPMSLFGANQFAHGGDPAQALGASQWPRPERGDSTHA